MLLTIVTFFVIGVIVLLDIAALLAMVYIFLKKYTNSVYVPMKYKTMNLTTEELYTELSIIIQNEIELYEKSIFENGGTFLTNKTFDNYYQDICNHIGEDIPDEFYAKFQYYMDEHAVKRFIARTVRKYLEEKLPE